MVTRPSTTICKWTLVVVILLVGLIALNVLFKVQTSSIAPVVAVDWGNSSCIAAKEHCLPQRPGGGGIGKCPGRSDHCLDAITFKWTGPKCLGAICPRVDWSDIAHPV